MKEHLVHTVLAINVLQGTYTFKAVVKNKDESELACLQIVIEMGP